ncbi:MAG: Phospholipase D-nuclease N-terminal [Actinomycetota bacterium]|jgi:hypothetical protein
MTPLLPAGADIFWSLVILALLAVEIWALVDIWKSKANQDRKIIWTLLVLFVNPIGAIVWFAAGKKANQ